MLIFREQLETWPLCSTDETRPALGHISIQNGVTYATDGAILAKVAIRGPRLEFSESEFPAVRGIPDGSEKDSVMIPRRLAKEIVASLPKDKGILGCALARIDNGTVYIATSNQDIHRVFQYKADDLTYPDVETVIPQDEYVGPKEDVLFNADKLLEVCQYTTKFPNYFKMSRLTLRDRVTTMSIIVDRDDFEAHLLIMPIRK